MNRATRWPRGGLIAMILLGTGCTAHEDGTTAGFKELYTFNSLPQMVATSTVIVDGTVASIQPGRVVGTGDAALQFTQVTLTVNEVLFGKLSTPLVALEEGGLEGNHPSKAGDRGIYFLHEKDDAPGYFSLVNRQGRFLQTPAGGLTAIDDDAQWVKDIEAMTLDELKAQVATAARAVQEGKVAPASPAK